MRTSTIIVNWNTRELILNCIKSLKPHISDTRDEIIVVDNASEDGSVAAIRSQFPTVTIIQCSSNLGFAKANNLAIEKCVGDVVFLVNSDIEAVSDPYVTILEYLAANPKVAAAAPRLLNADGSIQPSCWRFPTVGRAAYAAVGLNAFKRLSHYFSEGYVFKGDKTYPVDFACGAFLAVRRTAIEKVGLLDETFFFYGEDADWGWRFKNAGFESVYLSAIEVIHFGGQSSAKAPEHFSAQLVRAKLQFCKKHYSINRYILIRFFYGLHLSSKLIAHMVTALWPDRRAAALRSMKLALSALRFVLTGKFSRALTIKRGPKLSS
jgi:GT2 family glycosyltransferase